jgi:hypothetical protein
MISNRPGWRLILLWLVASEEQLEVQKTPM